VQRHAAVLEDMLRDPAFSNLFFDISWTEVAKYLVGSPEATKISADLINRYPDRFLFGTDEVAPVNQEKYLRIFNLYDPLWKLLTKDASAKVRRENYERLFDRARTRVRAWEPADLSFRLRGIPVVPRLLWQRILREPQMHQMDGFGENRARWLGLQESRPPNEN
jgi:hypothetical protein